MNQSNRHVIREHQQSASGWRSLLAHALWMASSVKLGLLLMVLIATYAALASIPLGPVFSVLGGEPWQPGRTLRHVPWVDLREAEYFATPLFSALLLGMVINMTLASVFRIPWRWKKVGVLFTHAGVVVLALGAFFATRNPLNATLAAFADLPAETAIDRSRTVIEQPTDGLSHRVDQILPRYADFGVPWTDRERALRVGSELYITEFAHSARLVPEVGTGEDGDPPGWQLIEQLSTGERRTFAVRGVLGSEARTVLSDGTVVLALDEGFGSTGIHQPFMEFDSSQGRGGILIRAAAEVPSFWLPAVPGAVAEIESAGEVWRAEFLDRSEFVPGTEVANFRLEGPQSQPNLYFAASWNPSMTGIFTASGDGGSIAMEGPPAGFRALYLDPNQDALVLTREGAMHFAGGAARDLDFSEGSTAQLSASTRITVDRFEPHAKVSADIQRIPMAEDAQLLADPRLGSLVRISASEDPHPSDEWLAFDDTEVQGFAGGAVAYRPAVLRIDDTRIIYRGFRAELFRRGSIPKDFHIDLELEQSGQTTHHTLSLNQPVRAKVKIKGRMRTIQFSLIGWDSEGWESSQGGPDDRFEGTRFVILAINQREGVATAISGGALVLLGAGLSMAIRLQRPRVKREKAER